MTTLLMLGPVLIPLVAAAVYRILRWRPATVWVGAVSAAGVLATAIGTAAQVTSSGPRTAVGGLLAVDALSAFMLIVIGAVAVVATAATPAHLRVELAAGRTDQRVCTQHSSLVQLFLAAMALAVLAASLGVLWVAIEATTVVTAFLVGQRRGRGPVEAAWKYVIICSTGIALALLGTFLLNYAAQHTPTPAGLDWVGLTAAAPDLDPGVTRIAVLLLILGFGTKAGLAPLHAWLPDAHSQAPAPVSALMSGVLDGAVSTDRADTSVDHPGAARPAAVAAPVQDPVIPVRTDPRRLGADSYALITALTACAVLGLTLGPLAPLLAQATTIVTGTAP
jgi:hydrogenase-4 component F